MIQQSHRDEVYHFQIKDRHHFQIVYVEVVVFGIVIKILMLILVVIHHPIIIIMIVVK